MFLSLSSWNYVQRTERLITAAAFLSVGSCEIARLEHCLSSLYVAIEGCRLGSSGGSWKVPTEKHASMQGAGKWLREERGAQLNSKKKGTKLLKPQSWQLHYKLKPPCRAAVVMSVLPIKGIKNNCTRCNFCSAPAVPAQCQPKVMFSLHTSPTHSLHFL